MDNEKIIKSNDRFEKGLEKFKEIAGEQGEELIQTLEEVAPGLGKYAAEFPFGDIYSRPGLDLKTREIATIAALTALGTATPQLKLHINAGLKAGITESEIREIIIQMAVYAGFPAAINAAFAAKEVFNERKSHDE